MNDLRIFVLIIVLLALPPSILSSTPCPCNGHAVCVNSECKIPNDDTTPCSLDSDCAVGFPRGTCQGNCKCETNYQWTYYYNDCALPNDNIGSKKCTSVSQCMDREDTVIAECGSNQKCRCKPGGIGTWVTGSIKCGRENDGTNSCANDYECYDYTNGHCNPGDSKCRCKDGYAWDTTHKICRALNTNTKTCTSVMDCYDHSERGLCDGKCTCASGFAYDAGIKACKAPNDGNYACTDANDCMDSGPGGACTGSICVCNSDYEWDGTAKKCLGYNNNAATCSAITDCYDQTADTTECQYTKCRCKSWSQWEPSLLRCKVPNDSTHTCSSTSHCIDSSDRAVCSTYCACANTCEYDGTTKKCKAPNDANFSCVDVNDCIDNGSFGDCASSKCDCVANYGWVASSKLCLAYNIGTLGCSTVADCYDQTSGIAECSSSICTCASNSSWDSLLLRCRSPNNGAYSCSDTDTCQDSSDRALCDGQCKCKATCNYDSTTGKCKAPNDGTLSCQSIDDCIVGSLGGGICSTTCQCDTGYEWDAGSKKCLAYNTGTLGCSSVADCFDQTSGIAGCISTKCACESWSSWDLVGLRCRKPNSGTYSCSDLGYCQDSSDRAVCDGNCKCKPTCSYDSTTGKCKAPNDGTLSCQSINDCIADTSHGGICSTTCQCDTGYEWDSGSKRCLAYNTGTLGCSSISECFDQTNGIAACTSSKCTCESWSSWDSTLKRCRGPNDGVYGCSDLTYCADSSDKASCSSGVCTCKATCVYDPTSKRCKAPNDNTFTCSSTADCIDSSGAASCTTKCTCNSGYGWVAGSSKCLAYNTNTIACSTITDCYDQTTNLAQCSTQCTCVAGWDASSHRCRVPNDGTHPCTDINICQDSDPQSSECSTNCVCKSMYEWDATRHKCLGPNDGTTACTGGTTGLCMDQSANAVCNGGFCECTTYYAWDSSLKQCVCAAGTYLNGGACDPCLQGYYQSQIGQSSCDSCPSGTENPSTGSTSSSDCVDCSPGTYSSGGAGQCSKCNTGYYQNLYRQSSCIACPPHSTSTSLGSTKCTCDSGYFDSGNFPNYCEECHEYCAECTGSRTTCTKCVANPGLEYISATNTCRCRVEALYKEWTNVLGKLECTSCSGCPYNFLVSATLKNEWTVIEILFSQNVLQPSGISNNSPQLCDELFSGNLTGLFGATYECTITGTMLTISLGENAEFAPTSTLTPNPGAFLLDTCACPYEDPIAIPSTSSVTFDFTASLSSTNPINYCSSLTVTVSNLQGTGNRPKFVSFTYSIDSAYSTDSAYERSQSFSVSKSFVSSFLSSKNESPLILTPGLLMESGAYVLKITLNTYLGSYSRLITITTSPPIVPVVSLKGAKSTIREWERVEITPILTASTCYANMAGRYRFNWSQVTTGPYDFMDESVLSSGYSNTEGVLQIAPYELLPEHMYGLKIDATHVDFPISVQAIATIKVMTSKILGHISGGDQSIGVKDDLFLDGSTSEDNTGLPGPMNYVWTCENVSSTDTTQDCVYSNRTLVKQFETTQLHFKAGDFWEESTMKWTLSIEKSEQYHSTYVIIRIIPDSGVLVGIKTSKEGLKVNRNKLVILSASAYSTTPYDLKYSWKSEPELPADSYANGVNEKYLKILPYKLKEGSRYTFTCTVTELDGTAGYAVIRVIVNRAPRFGSFKVTPTSGYSGTTRFSLKATGWLDDDLPITYLFSYFDSVAGVYIPLAPRSIETSFSSTFVALPGTLKLKVEVFDGYNATATEYQTINLTESNAPTNQLMETAADSSKSEYTRLQALAGVTKTLDCSNKEVECKEALETLNEIDRGITKRSTQTDEAILGILGSMDLNKGSHLSTVIEILGRIGTREKGNVGESLSVYEEQFQNKKVQFGLTQQGTTIMAGVLGKVLNKMSDPQVFEKQQTVLNIMDIVGRSLIKDSVPNERPIKIETPGFSMTAQKVSTCPSAFPITSNGTLKGVGYNIPICDMLPVNQTKFDSKKLNSVKPFDVIIQVFDRNVVGDCSPLPTKLLRIVLYDDYAKVQYPVHRALRDINFTFELNSSFPEDELGKVSCVYYEENITDFTPQTLKTTLVNLEKKQFMCSSYHLSEFTLMYLPIVTSKEFISTEFWVLLAVLAICVLMHAWATYFDYKHRIDVIQFLNEKALEYQVHSIFPEKSRPGSPPGISVSTYMPFGNSNNAFTNSKPNTQEDNSESPTKLIHSKHKASYNVTLKTISLVILILFTPPKIISKKACTQIFWNGFFIRLLCLTIYSQLMNKSIHVLILVLLSYFTGVPLSFLLELAIRSTAKTNIKNPGTDKVGEIQAKIYARLKLQGRLRTLGRVVSYIVITLCFIGIAKLYQLNKCTTSENVLNMALLFLYSIMVQDIINGILQVVLLTFVAKWEHGSKGIRKFLKQLILKEIIDLFKESNKKITPVNASQNAIPELDNSGNQVEASSESAAVGQTTSMGINNISQEGVEAEDPENIKP